ncbi:WGR domain-containing protein [Streptomyces sp. MS1.AVA.1]|uniref:WGR domain-containing protein n=1 Tax=Streptomyces machairae TaxID=3134109 RepID=A0ABU8US16_9ACTN
MRRWEFVGDGSAKFWEAEAGGAAVTVRYGRVGAAGRTQVKELDSAEAAEVHLAKMIAEKERKGYREVAAEVAAKDSAQAVESAPAVDTPAASPDGSSRPMRSSRPMTSSCPTRRPSKYRPPGGGWSIRGGAGSGVAPSRRARMPRNWWPAWRRRRRTGSSRCSPPRRATPGSSRQPARI